MVQPFLTIHLSARNHHSNTGKHAGHEGLKVDAPPSAASANRWATPQFLDHLNYLKSNNFLVSSITSHYHNRI